MIVSSRQLSELGGTVAMVSGGFDPLHDGHVVHFEEAAGLGAPVLCNITGDRYVAQKHPPLLAQDRRARVIDSLRPIDYTHVSDLPTHEVLQRARPRYFVKGVDWRGRLPEEEVRVCEEAGVEIVYMDTVVASSTQILAQCLDRYRKTQCA